MQHTLTHIASSCAKFHYFSSRFMSTAEKKQLEKLPLRESYSSPDDKDTDHKALKTQSETSLKSVNAIIYRESGDAIKKSH